MDPSVEELRLRHALAGATVLLRGEHLLMLLRKAGYRADQPRVPRGSADGGQWTDEIDWPLTRISHEPDKLPEIPEREPATVREKNSLGKSVARYLSATHAPLTAIRIAYWLKIYAEHRIVAYQQEPKRLYQLQEDAREIRPGYEIHHIVEQTPARQDGFPDSKINHWRNLVSIPTYKHWEITAWYATKNQRYDGLSPREFLRGATWEQRRQVGLEALRIHGLLI